MALLNYHTEPINGQSLEVIEKAQLVVCLDQSHPHTSQLQSSDSGAIGDYEKSILANRVLHGNGSKQNSSNRWFDHAVQVREVVSMITCMYMYIHVCIKSKSPLGTLINLHVLLRWLTNSHVVYYMYMYIYMHVPVVH